MAWSIAASASNSLAATSFAALRRSVSIFSPLALIHAATSQIRYESRNSEDDVHQAAECKNDRDCAGEDERSEEHTSELQSLMRISYAVFCLKKKKRCNHYTYQN